MRTHKTQQDGITLLITLLLMGVLLGVSTSMLNITLKQFQLSNIALASEMAFQSASAGMECALYTDLVRNEFELGPTREDISCFGIGSSDSLLPDNTIESGEEQRFMFSWSIGTGPVVCSVVSVYKFYSTSQNLSLILPDGNNMNIDRNDDEVINSADNCPIGSVCTVVQSRGYNAPCATIESGGKIVEREITQVY